MLVISEWGDFIWFRVSFPTLGLVNISAVKHRTLPYLLLFSEQLGCSVLGSLHLEVSPSGESRPQRAPSTKQASVCSVSVSFLQEYTPRAGCRLRAAGRALQENL